MNKRSVDLRKWSPVFRYRCKYKRKRNVRARTYATKLEKSQEGFNLPHRLTLTGLKFNQSYTDWSIWELINILTSLIG